MSLHTRQREIDTPPSAVCHCNPMPPPIMDVATSATMSAMRSRGFIRWPSCWTPLTDGLGAFSGREAPEVWAEAQPEVAQPKVFEFPWRPVLLPRFCACMYVIAASSGIAYCTICAVCVCPRHGLTRQTVVVRWSCAGFNTPVTCVFGGASLQPCVGLCVFLPQARQIIDSRGNPTVEVDLYTQLGLFRAAVPSGASTGAATCCVCVVASVRANLGRF